jgi:hypothetical protein
LQLVANLSLHGIGYPQGSIEVSTIHLMASSSPGLAWRNFLRNLSSRRAPSCVASAARPPYAAPLFDRNE